MLFNRLDGNMQNQNISQINSLYNACAYNNRRKIKQMDKLGGRKDDSFNQANATQY